MNYWEFALEPVKYTDDIYHIGSRNAPCWLIKSTDGLIILDTGLPKTFYQIIDNIHKLGVNFKDIKHIIHSHGHIDHIGGTRALVEMTGAKTYVSEGDAEMVRGNNDLQWATQYGWKFEEPFEPDVLVKDGDKIKIGEKVFTFISTPGHTAGTMSIFFNCYDNGKEYRAGTFGGGGLNTMSKSYMDKYNLPYSIRQDFLDGIDRVINEKVEVFLGNHIGDNKHFEKLEAQKNGAKENPFIETESWKLFLSTRRAQAIEKFEQDK